MDGCVGGRRARTQERQLQAQGDGRWEDTAAPRFPKTCMPASASPLHAHTRRPRAARGPGSDRGAARFARNFVVMAAVGPLILSSRRERGCWRSSGWSSGKESASRVPIRHIQPGSASSKRARLALPLAVPWTGGPSLLSRGLEDN